MDTILGRQRAALPDAPKVTPPPVMPDPLSPSVLEARKRTAADILARGGRQSTILTGSSPRTPASPAAPAAPSFDSYGSGKL